MCVCLYFDQQKNRHCRTIFIVQRIESIRVKNSLNSKNTQLSSKYDGDTQKSPPPSLNNNKHRTAQAIQCMQIFIDSPVLKTQYLFCEANTVANDFVFYLFVYLWLLWLFFCWLHCWEDIRFFSWWRRCYCYRRRRHNSVSNRADKILPKPDFSIDMKLIAAPKKNNNHHTNDRQ